MKNQDALFLGLDSSTQGLKAVLLGADLGVVHEGAVDFDADLPEFETTGGVHRHPDGLTVTSPPLMWVAALDLLLGRAREGGAPLDRVVAVSGSGQQHGSVWLKPGTRARLQGLAPERSLREQLSDVFAVAESPIWQDASTRAQCRQREAALGGAQAVADLTGSRAYERFTGNQIAKIHQTRPADYEATERIALVSSFVASLLAGDYVPIDTSDGSGMNLLDLQSRQWAPAALDCTAPALATKLGPPVPGHAVVGRVHRYFAERYGLRTDCLVVAFSGDNPNSLAGLRLQEAGDVAVSLGTSDTMFGALSDPRPSGVEGHVFANPVDPDTYMVMLGRRNGSLVRERIRDACAGGAWEAFGALLRRAPPGNQGKIGFYVDEPEITPPIFTAGTHRFGPDDGAVDEFDAATEIRALVEGQFLSLRLHGERIGLRSKRLLATGGASANREIVRVMCDVFGVPVHVAEVTASAALGAAYRALHGWTCAESGRFVPFPEVLAAAPPFARAADPDRDAHAVYTAMVGRFARLETRVAQSGGPGGE